jgi:hypothetical protein
VSFGARIALFFVSLASLACVARAQPPVDCPATSLPPIPREPSAFVVDTLAGQVVYQPAGERYPWGGISGVCIVAVAVATGEAVSSGLSGDRGEIELAAPSAGEYALIALHPEFDDLVVRFRVLGPGDSGTNTGVLVRLSEKERNASQASTIERLDLRSELARMLDVDQEVRNELIRAGMAAPDPAIEARIARIDAAHTRRLLAIVTALRWPDLALVGYDGAEAAFTLLQHAEYAVQKELYPRIEAAYESGQASGESYALLTDKILTSEGKPQIYGSRARPTEEWVDGEPVLYEIEDEANVDRRRAEVGMPPLAGYLKFMKGLYFPAGDGEPEPITPP